MWLVLPILCAIIYGIDVAFVRRRRRTNRRAREGDELEEEKKKMGGKKRYVLRIPYIMRRRRHRVDGCTNSRALRSRVISEGTNPATQLYEGVYTAE